MNIEGPKTENDRMIFILRILAKNQINEEDIAKGVTRFMGPDVVKKTISSLGFNGLITGVPGTHVIVNAMPSLDAIKYKLTAQGEIVLEAYDLDIENLEKKKSNLNNLVLKIFAITASVGTFGLLIWEIAIYESPSKIESLEKQNNIISTEMEQLQELYTRSIYTESQTYQYEKELNRLRDSLRVAKKSFSKKKD